MFVYVIVHCALLCVKFYVWLIVYVLECVIVYA